MRWSWRADLPPVAFDALLEGSLVGIAYLALATGGPNSSAPLSLVHFWLAAAAGVMLPRLRRGRLRRLASVPVLALLAGAAGWLADPAARAAIVGATDPLAVLAVDPAGWLLGMAVLRGAVHADAEREGETSTQAIAFAFPVLAVSLLLHIGSGGAFVVPIFIASAVCVVSGLLAIGHARLRELESLGSVTRGGHAWSLISAGLVAAVVVAIPVALFLGTSAQEFLASAAASAGAAIGALLAAVGNFLGFLQSVIVWLLHGLPSGPASPTPSPSPTTAPMTAPGPPPLPSGRNKSISLPSLPPLDWLARAGLVVGAFVLAIRLARLIAARQTSLPASATPEERSREPNAGRFGLHFPRPAFHSPFARRRQPTSAVGAYLALLDELAERGEFARGSSETPRSHAARAGSLGLPRLPLSLLAADYELAVYGQTPISELETARALGRRQLLRKQARRLEQAGAARAKD